MAGLFFCLASDTVQGFYFALLQYNPIQAFTVRFVLFVQLYRTRYKTAHRALQALFLRFALFYRPRYQTDTSGYNTACATPDAVQLSTAAYYNKVYKGGQCSIPQTVPAAGPRYFPRPAACDLAPGQQSGRTGLHSPPGGAVKRQGAQRAARNHWRLPPQLFSGFRPIANRGQQ